MRQPAADDDEDIVPVPFWKNRRLWAVIAIASVMIGGAFAINNSPPKTPPPSKPTYQAIQVVVPDTHPTPTTEIAPTPAVPVAPTPQQIMKAVTEQRPTPPVDKPFRPGVISFAPPPPRAAPPASTAPQASTTKLAFKGADLIGGKASAAYDDALMLMPGLLPLVLDTAISSDAPEGNLLAHTIGPIYSKKGAVLMPADTQVVGRYQGLKGGSNRLQATGATAWITYPEGVVGVPLTDNLTDELGRNGLDGEVNHRYIERFGAAISLQLGQSVLSYLQATASKGGNTYLSLNQGGGVGGLAEQILQSTINLPPIFSKHQGEVIALFISTPISFEDSYRLRIAKK